LQGHIADELAVKAAIVFKEDTVELGFELYSGLIFSTAFLKALDPDRNGVFEDPQIRDFMDAFARSLSIRLEGDERPLSPLSFESSPWDSFAAGIADIRLAYSLPLDSPMPLGGGSPPEAGGGAAPGDFRLDYRISFYPNVAVYSLSVLNGIPGALAILEEKRNEILQDRVEFRLSRDPGLIAALASPDPAPRGSPEGGAIAAGSGAGGLLRRAFGTGGLLSLVRGEGRNPGGPYDSPSGGFLGGPGGLGAGFLLIALGAGFLHAFTPGHGKALVGAFLIANRGTAFQALLLGLVITGTHTLSIYGFGVFSSVAARFFLPGEFIPLLGVLSGIFILALGLWNFAARIAGKGGGHAHLIANLGILKRGSVNILVDGRAADANEALLIALEDEGLQERLRAAGAEGFNLCSPGCTAHAGTPRLIQEWRRGGFFKAALATGAVDGAAGLSPGSLRRLGKLRDRSFLASGEAVLEAPGPFLDRALENYAARGAVRIPGEAVSWGRIAAFGVTGGIVPCPEALAVLLVSIAGGRILWGLWLIFFFSLGLAAALIITGMSLVAARRLLRRNRGFAFAESFLPRASALCIAALGALMIRSSWIW
jgi:nickel/cobalt exporter